jgi:hypothetical protein
MVPAPIFKEWLKLQSPGFRGVCRASRQCIGLCNRAAESGGILATGSASSLLLAD